MRCCCCNRLANPFDRMDLKNCVMFQARPASSLPHSPLLPSHACVGMAKQRVKGEYGRKAQDDKSYVDLFCISISASVFFAISLSTHQTSHVAVRTFLATCHRLLSLPALALLGLEKELERFWTCLASSKVICFKTS